MDWDDIVFGVLEWISPWAFLWFNAGLLASWLVGHVFPFFNREAPSVMFGLAGFAMGFQYDYRRRDYTSDLAVVGHLALALLVIGLEAAVVIGVLRNSA